MFHFLTQRRFRLPETCLASAAGLSLLMATGCQSMGGKADRTASTQPSAPPMAALKDLKSGQLAEVHFARARNVEAQGQLEEAIVAYQEVLKHDPKHADAALRIAVTYDKMGKFNQSGEWYAKTLEIRPGHPDAYCDRGYSLYLQNRWSDAEMNLKQCLSLKPDHIRAHNNLGLTLARMGRADEAMLAFRSGGCSTADAHNNLGLAMSMQGRFEDAERYYKLALASNPSSETAARSLEEVRQMLTQESRYESVLAESDRKQAADEAAFAARNPQQALPASPLQALPQNLPHDQAAASNAVPVSYQAVEPQQHAPQQPAPQYQALQHQPPQSQAPAYQPPVYQAPSASVAPRTEPSAAPAQANPSIDDQVRQVSAVSPERLPPAVYVPAQAVVEPTIEPTVEPQSVQAEVEPAPAAEPVAQPVVEPIAEQVVEAPAAAPTSMLALKTLLVEQKAEEPVVVEPQPEPVVAAAPSIDFLPPADPAPVYVAHTPAAQTPVVAAPVVAAPVAAPVVETPAVAAVVVQAPATSAAPVGLAQPSSLSRTSAAVETTASAPAEQPSTRAPSTRAPSTQKLQFMPGALRRDRTLDELDSADISG